MDELLDRSAAVNRLRSGRVEALLGGPDLGVDLSGVRTDLQDRVILLTGAAGSIGAELARQIAPFDPARLILLDQSESDLSSVYLELSDAYRGLELAPVTCDITNQARLAQVYSEYRPDYVIHAAGYKYVPLMVTNVLAAVRNDVLGTLLVATNAVRYGAAKLLLISTDQPIRPSSVMGATKRLAERIIFGLPNLHRTGTDFRAVRLGNVLATNRGVLPLFERQPAAGGPLTVIDPLVQRRFMTLPEATQLVLQAGSLGEATGAIAVLVMDEPVRILNLAEQLIRSSGRVPSEDVEIVFTGLRPGEKLIEEAISAREDTVPTSNEKIRISQTMEEAEPELLQQLSRLLAFLEAGDREGVLVTLYELVPECAGPLQQFRSRRTPKSNPQSGRTWQTPVPAQQTWRDGGHAMRQTAEPAELRLTDRREGVACRRGTPRIGGRRRTDVAAGCV